MRKYDMNILEEIQNCSVEWKELGEVAFLKRGKTITALSIESGLSANTLKSALQFKYPKGERIISDFLGVPPQEIWPSRYPEQV